MNILSNKNSDCRCYKCRQNIKYLSKNIYAPLLPIIIFSIIVLIYHFYVNLLDKEIIFL